MLKSLIDFLNPAVTSEAVVNLFMGQGQASAVLPVVASVDAGLTFGPHLPSADDINKLRETLDSNLQEKANPILEVRETVASSMAASPSVAPISSVQLSVTPSSSVTLSSVPAPIPAPTVSQSASYARSALDLVANHPIAAAGVGVGVGAVVAGALWLRSGSKIDLRVAFADVYATFEGKEHILAALSRLNTKEHSGVIAALNNQAAAAVFANLKPAQLPVFVKATADDKLSFIKGLLPTHDFQSAVSDAAPQQSGWAPSWLYKANAARLADSLVGRPAPAPVAAPPVVAAPPAVIAPMNSFNREVMAQIERLADASKKALAKERAQDPTVIAKFKPGILEYLNKKPEIAAQLLGQKKSYFDQFMATTEATQKLKLKTMPDKIAMQSQAPAVRRK